MNKTSLFLSLAASTLMAVSGGAGATASAGNDPPTPPECIDWGQEPAGGYLTLTYWTTRSPDLSDPINCNDRFGTEEPAPEPIGNGYWQYIKFRPMTFPVKPYISCQTSTSNKLACIAFPTTGDVRLSYDWQVKGSITLESSEDPAGNVTANVSCVGQGTSGELKLIVTNPLASKAMAVARTVDCGVDPAVLIDPGLPGTEPEAK